MRTVAETQGYSTDGLRYMASLYADDHPDVTTVINGLCDDVDRLREALERIAAMETVADLTGASVQGPDAATIASRALSKRRSADA